MRIVAGLISVAALGLFSSASVASGQTSEQWRDTFQSSPADTGINSDEEFDAFASRFRDLPGVTPELLEKWRPIYHSGTVRYRLTIAKGGSKFRLTISNETGTAPLVLSTVAVGAAGDAFSASPAKMKRATFAGKKSVTIAPGAFVVTDPVDLTVPDGGDLLVSIYGPNKFQLTPTRGSALTTAPGDQAMAHTLTTATVNTARPVVTAISVRAAAATRVIAALGDSITDGNAPTLGVLHSWPEQLYRRLLQTPNGRRYSIVNAGIGGNKLLTSGILPGSGLSVLERLDRDVLRVDGLSRIILLIGVNDITVSGVTPLGNQPVMTPSRLIAGYREIISRAHAKGVKVTIGTITPFGGALVADTPEKRKVRDEVNMWIRTSGEPDSVVDFDAALRDPNDPQRLRPEFNSGDNLHPNEAGSRAMGDAVDLALFP